jgi:hypothetical protein
MSWPFSCSVSRGQLSTLAPRANQATLQLAIVRLQAMQAMDSWSKQDARRHPFSIVRKALEDCLILRTP